MTGAQVAAPTGEALFLSQLAGHYGDRAADDPGR